MAKKGNQSKKRKVHERALDPTRDAQDIIGDTTGLTGITSGNPKNISAEPDEIWQDESNLPGGVIENEKQKENEENPAIIETDKKIEKEKILKGMSPTKKNQVKEQGSEPDEKIPS